MNQSSTIAALVAALSAVAPCFALPGTDRPFSLDLAGGLSLGVVAQETDSGQAIAEQPPIPPVFGSKGSSWLSISGSGMDDFADNTDYSLRLAYHQFIARDFEVNLALTAWYHDQPDNDELSGSFDLGFRYHFMRADDRRWTIYADTGIGLMLSTGEVPVGGTDYNFTPRAGLGTTLLLPQHLGGDRGARLDLGVGWQHYSNASTSGSDSNPARDSLIIRVGVIFPF